jgi:hypothetical protein
MGPKSRRRYEDREPLKKSFSRVVFILFRVIAPLASMRSARPYRRAVSSASVILRNSTLRTFRKSDVTPQRDITRWTTRAPELLL